MGLFFVYILKSSVCLVVFYLFYRLLLSRETFHRFNRFALLGTLLFSCLLPLIEVSVQQETEVHQTMMTLEQWLLLANAMNTVEMQAPEVTVTWIQVALLLYLTGVLFFAFRNIYSLSRMVMLLKSGRRESLSKYVSGKEKITLIIHDKDIAPFSWMKYVVISQKDLEENGREILIHELAHINNRHSLDLLVVDVCIFFQWFNPASWLLKQELQNIHEFEADETVIKQGVNAKQYQLLLIKKAVGTRLYSMANSFNHSKLKKRITMMLKEKSSPWARLKYLYVLPLAAVAVTAFARPEVSKQVEEISAVKVNDLAAIVETKVAESITSVLETPKANTLLGDTTKPANTKNVFKAVTQGLADRVYTMVDQMPQYPGGMPAFMKYLQDNMRYPEAAKKAGTQGRVIVQFIVDKDGSLKEPRIIRSVEKKMDAEAIRLIMASSKWEPGKHDGESVAVKYTMPVLFELDGKNAEVNGIVISHDENSKPATPLFIIDGKEVASSVIGALKVDAIESMTVLKDDTDTKLYGEKGKNGVILITLKNNGSTVVGVSGDNKKSASYSTSTTLTSSSSSAHGVGGISVKGASMDLQDYTIYIDNVKTALKGRIKEVIPSDQIESISVKNSSTVDNGVQKNSGEIYITTKKKAKSTEKTSAKNEMKVEGVVKDMQGKPLIGALVIIEGTQSGSITDTEGQFSLSVPNKDTSLVVSYIDMQTSKVKVSPKMTIVLKDE